MNLVNYYKMKKYRMLWDFNIHTNKLIETRMPDKVIVVDKEKRNCQIIDFRSPKYGKLNMRI